MTYIPRLLMVTVAVGLLACGSNKAEQPPGVANADAPAPLFGSGTAITLDDATARALPADTAGALTIADLPGLIARLGLTAESDLIGAFRAQLRDALGVDLLDPAAARNAGLRTDRPVTLAWLDPDAQHLALAVEVSDAAKLEDALSGRALLIRGDRALIPLGKTAAATRKRLDGVSAGHSLADSGVLTPVGDLQLATDTTLVLNPRAYPSLAPASAVAVGLRFDDDAALTSVAARFAGPTPAAAAWLEGVFEALGAADVPLPEHRLSLAMRTLSGGAVHTADLAAGLDDASAPANIVAKGEPGSTRRSIEDTRAAHAEAVYAAHRRMVATMGVTALIARPSPTAVTFHGAQLFERTTSRLFVAAAAQLAILPLARATHQERIAALEVRAAEEEATRQAGILGTLAQQEGGSFATLTGTGDFSSGLDDANVYGGLLGDDIGEMQGGFGNSGIGEGGGGTGWGTIGTGKYGTIGHGSGGGGQGYGTGSGRGGMRGRAANDPQVRIGNATATGDLDKNIIRRYIRRKLPQIKYCYEKRLLVEPKLSGKVTAQFTITPQGKVGTSDASGVDKEVAACVARVIRAIEFPKPKGGGVVQVSYPFVFKPTGG